MTELFENYLQREIDALKPAQAGIPVVRKFPFAYNTPGILTGAPLYTPNIGDILLDAWVEIDTAWNGITPSGDVAAFLGNTGWFSNSGGVLDMSRSDVSNGSEAPLGLLTQGPPSFGQGVPTGLMQAMIIPGQYQVRICPAKFVTNDSIKIVVSQDGTNIGANPGSTQGTAVLYLVTATPV